MNANVWDVTEPIQALIRGGLPVDPARLADPDIPLDQVTGDADTAQGAPDDQAAAALRPSTARVPGSTT